MSSLAPCKLVVLIHMLIPDPASIKWMFTAGFAKYSRNYHTIVSLDLFWLNKQKQTVIYAIIKNCGETDLSCLNMQKSINKGAVDDK